MNCSKKAPVIGVMLPCKQREVILDGRLSKYFLGVIDGNGVPFPLPYVNEMSTIEEYLAKAQGLLISGGVDIDSARYNAPLDSTSVVNPFYDEHSFLVLECAYKKKMPILGICRGIQLINVFLGGSLHQDIPNHKGGVLHEINNVSGIARVALGSDKVEVNSFHHQAVDKIGNNLRATSYSSDGIVESLEGVDYPYLLGVQWHPERMIGNGGEKIFKSFVEACVNYEN